MILKFELKKILAKKGSLIALLVLLVCIVSTAFFSINRATWLLEDGTEISGNKAIKKAKEEENKYKGIITKDVISQVIEQYKSISNNSKDGSLPEDGWQKIENISDLVALIGASYSSFRDFDFTLCGRLSTNESNKFYQNRIKQIKDWLNTDDTINYTEKEKKYFIKSAETLSTPFTYSYMDGWEVVMTDIVIILPFVIIILCIIVASVFYKEYQSGMDSILFSSQYGKDKVAKAKVISVYLLSTIIYWSATLLFSLIVLLVYGFDGANCSIQVCRQLFRSFYHLTNVQAFWGILGLGYIGTLLMVSLTMFISAMSKTILKIVTIPFALLFIPYMIDFSKMSQGVYNIANLLPHNTIQGLTIFKLYNVYQIGGLVISQYEMILLVYFILIIIFPFITIYSYRKHKIS